MIAQRKLRVIVLLTELEQELRELGWWEQQEPSAQALQSEQPFSVDTLEFSQWLQWVFVPRMHSIARSDHALPAQCAIYEMAEVVYREQRTETARLLCCLKRIDATVIAPHTFH